MDGVAVGVEAGVAFAEAVLVGLGLGVLAGEAVAGFVFVGVCDGVLLGVLFGVCLGDAVAVMLGVGFEAVVFLVPEEVEPVPDPLELPAPLELEPLGPDPELEPLDPDDLRGTTIVLFGLVLFGLEILEVEPS